MTEQGAVILNLEQLCGCSQTSQNGRTKDKRIQVEINVLEKLEARRANQQRNMDQGWSPELTKEQPGGNRKRD